MRSPRRHARHTDGDRPVDRLQGTVFPVITGRTGTSPILGGAGDFDLELLESHTLDGRTMELTYRPRPARG